MHSPPTLTAISKCDIVHGKLVNAARRYTLRYSIWRWRPACGGSPMSKEAGFGSPMSDFGISCEGTLKWPSNCTALPRPSPGRTR